jgi:hypothetical protein
MRNKKNDVVYSPLFSGTQGRDPSVVWLDLPALVVALAPLPEHDLGAVADAAMPLVTVEGVEVEVDVVHHADAAEAVADVAALRPQH